MSDTISHWNYRVIERRNAASGDIYYTIHEVYYMGDTIVGWIDEETAPYGDTPSDLLADLTNMQKALNKPILRVNGEKLEEITI